MILETFHRSQTDKFLGGVCGGVAEYLDIPTWLVRLIWVVLTFIPYLTIPSILIYILMWIFVPLGSKALDPNTVDAEFKVKE